MSEPSQFSGRRQVLIIEKWHPCTTNQLLECHHYQRARLKRIDRHMIMGYCALHRFRLATGKRRVELTIVRGETDPGRDADPDARWKSLLDALVWAKMLIDDSEEWCEHRFMGNERGETKSTRIEIIDI